VGGKKNGSSGNHFNDHLVCAVADLKERDFISEMGNWSSEGEKFQQAFAYPPPAHLNCEAALPVDTIWEEFAKPSLVAAEQQNCDVVVKNISEGMQLRKLVVETTFPDKQYEMVYIPVYLSSYTYNNTSFRLLINGVSGTVYGARPYWIGPIGSLGAATVGFLGRRIWG